MQDLILETRNLTKTFGGIVAVNNVDLKVNRGLCHAIIGPNGAGKSTLFNLISGILKPTSGKIFFCGMEITGLPPYKISKIGIGRSFQIYNLFPNLTVLENVRLAVQAHDRKASRSLFKPLRSFRNVTMEAMRIIASVGLWGKASIPVRNLTPSDKRKLEIAMAMAGDPKLLLLDEPTSGVSVEEIQSIIGVIEKIKKTREKTILLIEHKIDVVMKIADLISVMDRGKVIAEGKPREIVENRRVQEIYMGGAV
ncbi:MAG TPA: ABC transporter ATP-binding protein [Candidatus Bathyarchaeota archaeon]|nr:ABC transporter ATP-binding protein [Candidatus Bathyarchaeota archaeon]